MKNLSRILKVEVQIPLERALFAARWLTAPIYAGLAFCLLALMLIFIQYLVGLARHIFRLTVHEAVVATLSLIDLALVANLVLIVILTGYENFVSRLDIGDHVERPDWLKQVDYGGLKAKLFGSIAAITGIELLKAFMDIRNGDRFDPVTLKWLLSIHLAFLLTMTLSVFKQWIEVRIHREIAVTRAHHADEGSGSSGSD
jgi:uncharacterized protein (TIGR00645 family)